MANARELYREGRLDEALEALGAEVRDHPTDAQRRTFLFELLCFAGKYDRAEKQLGVLEQAGKEASLGALVYHSALHAERLRQSMFEQRSFPTGSAPPPVSGKLNGSSFTTMEDGDPRIGARLEIFAAGQYTWFPLEQVASVHMEPPKRLRDLLWPSARVQTSEAARGIDLGDVILPAIAPLTWQHPDGQVRLGRVTEWRALDDGTAVPLGQKMLLVDGEEFPFLEIRELEITPGTVASS